VIGASVISAVGYARRWSQSPAKQFVTDLRHNLAAAGPGVRVFDTYLPDRIQPGITEYRKVSDLAHMINDGVTFNAPGSRVVDENGRLVPARFFANAPVDTSGPSSFCNDPISGTSERRQILLRPLGSNEWFVKVQYFAQYASIIYLEAVDERGNRIQPVEGRRLLLSDHLGTAYVQLPLSRPTSLIVRGATAGTRVCITSLAVGYPFPAGTGS